VNGVVRTYERLAVEAGKLGFEIVFLAPSAFRTLPCPTYPEIRLSLAGPRAIAAHIQKAKPDFIHIATEGPIGLMTRRYCRKTKWPFTTSYHTRFPEYVSARLPVPESWCYALQRRFHNGAAGTFVATQSIEDELHARGFERLMRWSRGVDTDLFRPRKVRLFGEKPVFLYVGRIAVEKNIKAFLEADLPGRKVLVGSGPQSADLARRYPEALFAGPMEGEELARAYASADAFVFPSLTDTFGLVLLEALASGVTDPCSGVTDWDLKAAMAKALSLDRRAARAHALRYSWENSARQFIDNVLIAHHRKLPERRRRWRRNRQKKTARLGGNRAVSLSCVSLGDAWGISRPSRNG
jgi:glycosyltransferase involved in cell wall biosynthesis